MKAKSKSAHENWYDKLIESYRENLDQSKHKLAKSLYHDELEKLNEQADRAFKYSEGSNCIVYTRSKEMASEVLEHLKDHVTSPEYKKEKGVTIATVTINPLLVKSEEQMFCQMLKVLRGRELAQTEVKGYTSHEFWEILTSSEDWGMLVILEELEAHVLSSRQGLLYKLFDLLHYGPIKFFFVAISQNITIVDSFEKRIKSRYSHRYFYNI